MNDQAADENDDSLKPRKPIWRFNTRWFCIEKIRGGEISPEGQPVWLCWYDCHLHIHNSLPQLLWQVATEFRHDRHLSM